MPGGRLSYQDRGAIAAGIAAGLSQAEIARRLNRPTSTISREVARNGGPSGYGADAAQAATGQRAQRAQRPQAAMAPAAEVSAGERPELREIEGFFVATLMQSGVPRTMARILTCLYLTDSGSLTAAELVRRLRVSPATISKAVGFLEQHELIRREAALTGRRERYSVDEELWFRNWQASARQVEDLATAGQRAAAVLGPDTPAGARLLFMAEFLNALRGDMVKAADHWWSELRSRYLQARGAEATAAGSGEPG
jgi:DNA-binding transcriptional ArsR family regulator